MVLTKTGAFIATLVGTLVACLTLFIINVSSKKKPFETKSIWIASAVAGVVQLGVIMTVMS